MGNRQTTNSNHVCNNEIIIGVKWKPSKARGWLFIEEIIVNIRKIMIELNRLIRRSRRVAAPSSKFKVSHCHSSNDMNDEYLFVPFYLTFTPFSLSFSIQSTYDRFRCSLLFQFSSFKLQNFRNMWRCMQACQLKKNTHYNMISCSLEVGNAVKHQIRSILKIHTHKWILNPFFRLTAFSIPCYSNDSPSFLSMFSFQDINLNHITYAVATNMNSL